MMQTHIITFSRRRDMDNYSRQTANSLLLYYPKTFFFQTTEVQESHLHKGGGREQKRENSVMCCCKPQSDDITRVLRGTHLPRAMPPSYPHTCRERVAVLLICIPLLLLQPTHPTWGMYRNDTTLHITHLHKPNLELDPKLSCNHEEVHFCTHRAPIA